MSTCLVTGGAGFIGSHLVEGLGRAGHDVIVLDDLSRGRVSNLESARAALRGQGHLHRICFVEGNVLDEDLIRDAARGVDAIFHLAAVSSVESASRDPLHTERVNVDGTRCVIEAARNAGVRRLVYAGSAAVYGKPVDLPLDEERTLEPLSVYAESKLAGERLCLEAQERGELAAVVLRYFNVFGPRQDAEGGAASVISRYVAALFEGKALRIFGNGRQSRDFCYVGDAVRATLCALEAPEAVGQAINVASGTRTTLLSLVRELESLCSRRAELRFEAPREGDVPHSQADVGRAAQLLGFRPEVGLREGLERTLADLRARPERRDAEAPLQAPGLA